jgi:S1-C subfamily serine protease
MRRPGENTGRAIMRVCLVGLLALAPAPAAAFQNEAAVVRIVSPGGQVGSGFVFWISSDAGNTAYVLTAFHVVQEFDLENSFRVTFPRSDLTATGRVTGQPYPELDLAVLQLDRHPSGLRPLRFGSVRELAAGAPVHTWGYPAGGRLERDDGTVSRRSGGRLYLDDINPAFGNSGGPLMDGGRGEVVGMVVQKSTGVEAQYAVSADLIRAVVEDDFVFAELASAEQAPFRPDPMLMGTVRLRREYASLSEEDADRMVVERGFYARDVNPIGRGVENQFQPLEVERGGLPEGMRVRTLLPDEIQRLPPPKRDQGVLVTEVLANSEADYSGFRAGDVIWTLAGRSFGDASDLVAASRALQPGTNVSIELTRDGQMRVLDQRTVRRSDQVVIDHTTGLMWQRAVPDDVELNYKDFQATRVWVAHLNKIGFAGHSDWRIPTLEELLSLMEPAPMREGTWVPRYLDPVFTGGRGADLWTSDGWEGLEDTYRWTVNFYRGTYEVSRSLAFVRVVRSTGG